MSAAAEHFIDVATRPLAHDPDLRAAAATELRDRIATHGGGRDAELAEAATTLERSDHSPLRKWRTGLVAVMLLVSLPMLGVGGWALVKVKSTVRSAIPTQDGLPRVADAVPHGLPPAERLLLTGDPAGRTAAERWRPLWRSEPDNRVFLAKFAIAYFNTHKTLSPEIIDAANRIDPDNGWFNALAAAGLAKQAIEKLKITTKESQQGKATPWRILDEAKFRESLALAHQAAEKPAFSTYQTEFHQLRMKLLPPPTDFVSTAVTLLHAADSDDGTVPLRYLSDALAAAAQAAARNHDAAGFDAALGDWLWLCRTSNRTANTLVGQLVAQVMISGPSRAFRDAARELDLAKPAEILASVEEHLRLEREELHSNFWNQPIGDLVRQRGSIMAALSLPRGSSLVRTPPPVTADDLRPGRLANHALLDRMLAAAMWLLLGCGAAAAISPGFLGRNTRSHAGRLPGRLAGRLVALLRLSDWGWILIGGVLVPLAWYLLITRFTPLSAREWSLQMTTFVQPCAQYLALGLMIVMAPLAISRWRLGTRGAPLGWSGGGWRLDGPALTLLALAVPALGWEGLLSGSMNGFLLAAIILLGLPSLWLLVQVVKLFLVASPHTLRRSTVTQAAATAWVFAMLLCGIALPIHHAEERYWTQRDHLMAVPTDSPSFSSYEARITEQLRTEIEAKLKPLAALDPD